MLVKVYSMTAEDVLAELKEADSRSFEHVGSHDDSRLVVGINSEPRVVCREKYSWTSVQDSEYREKENDPGEMPRVYQIKTAWILENSYHYGSSQRPRSTIKFFVRQNRGKAHDGSDAKFLILDIGQVGGGSIPPFNSQTSLMEVLYSCAIVNHARVRVEIEDEDYETIRDEFVEAAKMMRRIVSLAKDVVPEGFESESIVANAAYAFIEKAWEATALFDRFRYKRI